MVVQFNDVGMVAQELRIGNFVITEYGIRKIATVEQLQCSTLVDGCIFALRHFNYSVVKPIPLTEEILLKCGFKDEEPYYVLDIHGTQLCYYQYKLDDNRRHRFSMSGIPLSINYLHQLQNFYFQLTYEELNVKL